MPRGIMHPTKTTHPLTVPIERDNMTITEYTSRLLPPIFSMAFSPSEGPVRKFLSSVIACLSVAAVVFPLAGCIAHAPGSGGGGQQTTVTVTPATATVSGGNTQNFTATVTGPSETAVTWYVNGVQNGNSTLGTLTPGTSGTNTAVYTAPTTVPTPPTVSVTAAAVANGTTSKASTVTITQSTVTVALTPPTTATVDAGATWNLTATVTGTTNVAVNWSVDGILNGNSTVGTITATSTPTGSTAVYTAPTAAPSNTTTVTITATAAADVGASASATATIPAIVVTLSPPSGVSIPWGGTQQFTATVTGTSNTAVTNWQVNGTTGGSQTLGTILSSGSDTAIYTAPTTNLTASPLQVTITAASVADSAATGSILANVHVTVTVTPSTDTIGQGANRQFTATVNGSTNQNVIWNASCPTCPTGQTGGKFDINNLGLYFAPGFAAGVTQVTDSITAAPAIDPTATPGTATMTVLANDPLGTVTPATAAAAQISCPTFSGGLSGATCYQLKVSCDAVADYNVYLKVNTPTTPVGTVIFGTGSGGNTLYDDEPSFIVGAVNGGETIVQGVFNAGYTTVQVSYGGPFDSTASTNGWLQGPGGVRRLACRYATAADWIYKNIHNSNTPMCATGHREGSGALGYAVTEYGLASEFSLIEHTSGPAMTLLHWGCNVCGGQYVGSDPCTHATGVNMCYSLSSGGSDIDASLIDAAYQVAGQSTPTLCTNGINADNTNFSRFLSDSIEDDPGVNPKFPIPNPPTNVNVVFGNLDTGTAALPQGYAWWGGVGPQPPAPTCVATAAQAIPADNTPVTGGAAQILSDITSKCTVH